MALIASRLGRHHDEARDRADERADNKWCRSADLGRGSHEGIRSCSLYIYRISHYEHAIRHWAWSGRGPSLVTSLD